MIEHIHVSFENLSRVDGTARFAFGEQMRVQTYAQKLTVARDRQNRRTRLCLRAHRSPLVSRKSISGNVRRPPETSFWRSSDRCTRIGLVNPIGAHSFSHPYTPPTHAHPARAAGSFFPSVFPIVLDTTHTGTE
jgi:hypothetical protein